MNENENLEQKDRTTEELLKAMDEMKKNSVPKEKFEKLEQDNALLIKQLADGSGQTEQNEIKETISDDELLERAFSQNGRSNLEHWTDIIEYRKRKLAKGVDPFIANTTTRHTPDPASYAAAERVATEIEDCIKIADGDPAVFDVELGRRLAEPNLPFLK